MDVKKILVARWADTLALPSAYVVLHTAPPVHQGNCGACWAIAAASCFCDRARLPLTEVGYKDITQNSQQCIKYGRHVACNSRCDGGFLASGLMYIHSVGYLAHRDRVKCGTVYRVNLFDTFGIVAKTFVDAPNLSASQLLKNSMNIAREIYMRGSVCATFNLFSDFMHFWNTQQEDAVYELANIKDTQGSKSWSAARPGPGGNVFVVSHCVIIVGFGTLASGLEYWVCKSSWGAPPNRPRGLFRIKRGVNMCGIESDVMACLPLQHHVLTQTCELVPLQRTSLLRPRDLLVVGLITTLVFTIAMLRTTESNKK